MASDSKVVKEGSGKAPRQLASVAVVAASARWQWWWQQVQGACQASCRPSNEGSRQVRGLDEQLGSQTRMPQCFLDALQCARIVPPHCFRPLHKIPPNLATLGCCDALLVQLNQLQTCRSCNILRLALVNLAACCEACKYTRLQTRIVSQFVATAPLAACTFYSGDGVGATLGLTTHLACKASLKCRLLGV
jgi:hypothetical protein